MRYSLFLVQFHSHYGVKRIANTQVGWGGGKEVINGQWFITKDYYYCY